MDGQDALILTAAELLDNAGGQRRSINTRARHLRQGNATPFLPSRLFKCHAMVTVLFLAKLADVEA